MPFVAAEPRTAVFALRPSIPFDEVTGKLRQFSACPGEGRPDDQGRTGAPGVSRRTG